MSIISDTQRICELCGAALIRKDFGYRMESFFRFHERRFCGPRCSALYREEMHSETPEQRITSFWAYGDCWTWTGARNKGGYGNWRNADGSQIKAHRFSFRIHHGSIDISLMVCHHCDNRSCVRPDHLYQGTGKQNAMDAFRRGRRGGSRLPVDLQMIHAEYKSLPSYESGIKKPGEVTKLAKKFGIAPNEISRIIRKGLINSSPPIRWEDLP